MDSGSLTFSLGHVVMLLIYVVVIVGVVILLRWIFSFMYGKKNRTSDEDSAMEILEKRYARGEIDKEEFEEKKKDLTT